MKHPAYHLRPNKMIERLAFVDAIKRLERLNNDGLSNYIYYGMGGPYLEDFRLLYESCPNLNMISIEINEETIKRQEFHLPSSNVQLENIDADSFISQFNSQGTQSIFWLDYTNLKYQHFESFKILLSTVEEMSMIKITLCCNPNTYINPTTDIAQKEKLDRFLTEFESVLPPSTTHIPKNYQRFAELLQEMLKISSEQALEPSVSTLTFAPVSSFVYHDSIGIFTLTGIVCKNNDQEEIGLAYQDWHLANLDWSPPKLIRVPALSTKERLHLQHLLPLPHNAGLTLHDALGYRIDSSTKKTRAALEQYAEFHLYSPHIMKAVP